MPDKKLIFIYNADTGIFNTVTDIAHKIFSPKSYECQLCKITHGWFSMHEQWSDGIKKLGCDIEYLHRDQISDEYAEACEGVRFPCILIQENTDQEHALRVLLSKQDIEKCDDITVMLDMITQKLK